MTIDAPHARALAYLAAACRPEGATHWDPPGITAAINRVANRPLADVILAVTRAAADPTATTPGVISATDSIHWREHIADREPSTFTPPTSRDNCPRHPGHYRERCAGCRADQLAQAGREDPDASSDEPYDQTELRRRLQAATAAHRNQEHPHTGHDQEPSNA